MQNKIKSILIANRGEIAIRIARTAKKMGITSYAIQTPQEPNALYLNHVDNIIESPKTESGKLIFLNPEIIVQMALDHRVDAIHPGYGFLSESSELAELCELKKLVFIGPRSSVISMMGNKDKAKKIAIEAGLPVAIGSKAPVSSIEKAKKDIKDIRYPVIIKALAGGGGKGMRVVENEKQLESAFKMAVSEAKNAFNNGDMIVEKYIEEPRHIEIQVLADKHGNVVHLHSRECSIQRNHQKLIEEAPAGGITEEQKEKISKCAVQIAQRTNYSTLGTVEFLLDKNSNFYFMEMNTRVQVEHPVTEAITGIDLIEWQIRTAAGEKLPFNQEAIKIHGHAIEFRINAEDVQSGFAPNFGIIDDFTLPNSPFLRVETGFKSGSAMPVQFDSLIAKLIISGKTRDDAIENSKQVIDQSIITGLKTTIPFIKAVLNTTDFTKGETNTSFIKRMKTTFFQESKEEEAAALIALFGYLKDIEEINNTPITPGLAAPWTSNSYRV